MNSRSLVFGLLGGATVLGAIAPAQAFSFQTNFQAALSGANAPKGDILLESVKLTSGELRTEFSLVNRATIRYNDQFVGGNSGAASADRGDLATGVLDEALDTTSLVSVLNNRNLSNIIDTEDNGVFEFNLFFEKAVDNIFVWERGGTGNQFGNSRLDIQAIDAAGNVLGNLVQLGTSANPWRNAGYQLDTVEINNTQNVGSLGISLADLGLTNSIMGVRVVSQKNYNGPDWKLVGSTDPRTQTTPEPAMLLGFGLVVLGGALGARKRQAPQAA